MPLSRLRRNIGRGFQRIIDSIRGKSRDSDSTQDWKTDVTSFNVDGNFTFKTKNLTIPTGNGRNKDGGFEWIIARLEGEGFNRILIMVMGGSRPPTRVFMQHSDGSHEFQNSVWSMPLEEESSWEVGSDNNGIYIKLNGSTIWYKSGGYKIQRVIMNGYANRESTGKWCK